MRETETTHGDFEIAHGVTLMLAEDKSKAAITQANPTGRLRVRATLNFEFACNSACQSVSYGWGSSAWEAVIDLAKKTQPEDEDLRERLKICAAAMLRRG